MKDRIERYELRCSGNPDFIAKKIEGIGGSLYEVSRSGVIKAGLSNAQLLDLKDKVSDITITLEE